MKDYPARQIRELQNNPAKGEVDWARLYRIAHTLRLEGDYVTAQVVEREVRQLLAAPAPPQP